MSNCSDRFRVNIIKKVLITGGAGFIGFHLAKNLLSNGYKVDLFDNFSRGINDIELQEATKDQNLKIISADLLNVGSLDNLDLNYNYIYHFAAIIGVKNVINNPLSVLKDNVFMLTSILDFAKKNEKLNRFIFASTSEVYAGTLKHFGLPIPTPESTPLTLTSLENPRTSYMLSKIYGEALCHQSNVPFTIIRPHNIYGPRMGMAHVIPELLKKAYQFNNRKLDVFSVDHRRTFCYVDDATEMIRRAAESNIENNTINIGSVNEEITIRWLAKLIIRIVGKDLKIQEMSDTEGSPLRRCPDMNETIKITGYNPKISMEYGIQKTFDWYKKHFFETEKLNANDY